jgi:uncharacterized protein YaaN involved in tellurite resistance
MEESGCNCTDTFETKDALTSQRIVSSTTNDLLTKNSEMLKQSSIEAARENERGVVDIETLKTTQANLIETIQETMNIQREGAIKRRQGEVELAQLEEEIKTKLLALSNKTKRVILFFFNSKLDYTIFDKVMKKM